MYTIDQIADEYQNMRELGIILDTGFEDYLRDNYVQVYDDQFNFIGYERGG